MLAAWCQEPVDARLLDGVRVTRVSGDSTNDVSSALTSFGCYCNPSFLALYYIGNGERRCRRFRPVISRVSGRSYRCLLGSPSIRSVLMVIASPTQNLSMAYLP